MDDATREALENPQKKEVVLEKDVDKTEGGMTEGAYKAKMDTAQEALKKIPEEKIPPEKKGFFDTIKNTFSTITAKWEANKIAKAESVIAGHAGLKKLLASIQDKPEEVAALKRYVAKYPDELNYYIKYDPKQGEFDANTRGGETLTY